MNINTSLLISFTVYYCDFITTNGIRLNKGWSLLKDSIFIYASECQYVCHVCAVPMEVRRGHCITWNWSYRQFVSYHVGAWTELTAFARAAASALNY